MAQKLTRARLIAFLEKLGRAARTPGKCYLTGGTSAVLVGWRETTIDIDLKFDPEPQGAFDAIPALKRELSINVELASPDDFIPPLAEWQSRSTPVGTFGMLTVLHYDFTAQALSKLVRGHERDIHDVREILKRGLVDKAGIQRGLEEIRPSLKRYPALDEETIVTRVKEFLEATDDV